MTESVDMGGAPLTPPYQPHPIVHPGWYADPELQHTLRYWDGSSWTDHRAPIAIAGPAQTQTADALAIGSLITAVAGIAFGQMAGTWTFALALGLVALVLGGLAYRRNQPGQRAMAAWGQVLSVIAILCGIWGAATIQDASNDLVELDRELEQIESDYGY